VAASVAKQFFLRKTAVLPNGVELLVKATAVSLGNDDDAIRLLANLEDEIDLLLEDHDCTPGNGNGAQLLGSLAVH
jgi:hypothetical protein